MDPVEVLNAGVNTYVAVEGIPPAAFGVTVIAPFETATESTYVVDVVPGMPFVPSEQPEVVPSACAHTETAVLYPSAIEITSENRARVV